MFWADARRRMGARAAPEVPLERAGPLAQAELLERAGPLAQAELLARAGPLAQAELLARAGLREQAGLLGLGAPAARTRAPPRAP